jgi:AraC-like DNA-binding protein
LNFRRIYPSEALRPFVRQYWIFEIGEEDVPHAQLFFPYGSHELIFYLLGNALMTYAGNGETFIQKNSFYSGQFTLPYELKFNRPCRCIGVSFYPWVGNLPYKIPSSEFTDKMVTLDCLENDNLFERLCELKNDMPFDLLEKYLKEKLQVSNVDLVSAAIARQIIRNPERSELQKFLSTIGLSKRRLQQRFLESTGLPMSLFLRKARFQKSILLLQNRTQDFTLTQIALLAGYYDQAHFINEFKAFAYKTP